MRDKFYDPKNKANNPSDDEYEYANDNDFIETKADELFHIGQSYEGKVAETIFCKHCGGNTFNVGSGDYYTAIRCINCEWEYNIHSG